MKNVRVALILCLLASGVVGALLLGWVLEADNGSVPEWMEALGTSAALLVAAIAVRQELKDRHDDRELRARKAARQFSVQVGASGVHRQHQNINPTYVNESEDFVYDVVLEVFAPDGARLGVDSLEDLGPSERAERTFRIAWIEFENLRWTLSWRDTLGARWLRTHRGEVRRATTDR